MDRRVQWALVGLLAVALAYAGIVTRYQYLSTAPSRLLAGRIRVDRWTGAVQVWGCLQYQSASPAPRAAIQRQSRQLETLADLKKWLEEEEWRERVQRVCVRYGWKEWRRD